MDAIMPSEEIMIQVICTLIASTVLGLSLAYAAATFKPDVTLQIAVGIKPTIRTETEEPPLKWWQWRKRRQQNK